MRHLLPFACLLVAAVAHAAPDIDTPHKSGVTAPADTAVVIGIEDYAFVPDVPYAQRDAKAFYDLLVYTVGLPASRVRLLDQGAGKEQILDAVTAAGAEVGAGGTVWLYFAGHGAADPSTGQRLLLGDDVRQDPAAFSIRGIAVEALKTLAGAGGGQVVAVIDACYSGLGRGGEELVAGKRFLVPAYARPTTATVIEWNAADGDQLSGPLPAVQHGAFTYFAVGALRGWADGHVTGTPDGKVTAEEAQLYVVDALRTVQITDQVPQLATAGGEGRTLSTGQEPAPELTSGMFAVATGGTMTVAVPKGPLTLGDRTVVQGWLQGVVDRCFADMAQGDHRLGSWTVRFKLKGSAIKGLFVNYGQYTEDPNALLTWKCITSEIKAMTWTPVTAPVVFTSTFRVTDAPAAPPPAPVAAAATIPGTTLVIRSTDGEWVDVRVDGAIVAELRGTNAEERVKISSGMHTVSFSKFLTDGAYQQGKLLTGDATEIVLGVRVDGPIEVYNHDGWTPE